jgi:alkanesulfonate monooxygenase SsuD/methylene tetrahydromethanopterin reductase-like flavin-dependent oxidoreductase (luciferase family)
MAFFGIRFDLRNPPMAATTSSERFQAAIDMAVWADELGAGFVGLSEHHGCDDGYLPSPLVMAAAIASRTTRIQIGITAVVAPFYDPLRLAEDIAVVDLLSAGRLSVTLANGYVESEFDMFGVALSERAKRTTETVKTLRQAWTGEPFDYRGRTVRVTPAPHQAGGPPISLGGTSAAAARRAARIADGFSPSNPEAWEAYREEMLALGKPDPGPGRGGGGTNVTHLAVDPESAWDAAGPYFLHESNAYGAWQAATGLETGYRTVADVDTLRRRGQYRILTPDELLAELKDQGPNAVAMFHPMVGGMPPALAWESLHLFEHEVLPRL